MMTDFIDEDMLVNIGTTVILASVKNPAKKKRLKRVMFKIFRSLGTAYVGDKDFIAFAAAMAEGNLDDSAG